MMIERVVEGGGSNGEDELHETLVKDQIVRLLHLITFSSLSANVKASNYGKENRSTFET